MEKEQVKAEVKEKLDLLPTINEGLKELKALFSGTKPDEKKEDKPAAPKDEAKAEAKTEAKVEFNHEAFTKEYQEFKNKIEGDVKASSEKFVALEAQLKTASETITKQDEQLKKMFSLVETMTAKFNELPTALSNQKKKEGVKSENKPDISVEKHGLQMWQ